MKKKCNKCGKIKFVSEFYKIKNGKYGVRGQCKLCNSKDSKIYYEKFKIKIDKYYKNYRDKNKDKIKKYQKNYYLLYKDDKKLLNRKQKKIRAEYDKKYYNDNKEKRIKQNVKRRRERMKTDINFRIISNLRRRFHLAIKGKNNSISILFLIGCEVDYLIFHIQNKFTEDMNWDNYGRGYGKWNIDHIKPCANFDLSKTEEQRKCFNFKNLQPLWAIDNLKKGIN